MTMDVPTWNSSSHLETTSGQPREPSQQYMAGLEDWLALEYEDVEPT